MQIFIFILQYSTQEDITAIVLFWNKIKYNTIKKGFVPCMQIKEWKICQIERFFFNFYLLIYYQRYVDFRNKKTIRVFSLYILPKNI